MGGDFTKSYTSYQRLRGCSDSFAAHGAVFDADRCYEKARFSFDSGYRGMERLVTKFPDITAVFAEFFNPKLATIKQQYQRLASRSIEILFGQIELKKEPIHEIVPFEFVNGESIRVIEHG